MKEHDETLVPGGAGPVTCELLIGFLLDYLEGELPGERRRAFEEHLAECDSCVAYLETYRETIRLARAAWEPARSAAEAMPPELVRAILASRR